MDKIMKNAVGMITVGIEDYLIGEEYRKYSAVRSIYAGILLLYKAYLYRITPQGGNQGDLIYLHESDVDINTDLSANYKRKIKRNKTIGFDEIIKLLNKTGYSVENDKLRRLNKLRCEIEHLYVNEELKTVDEVFYFSTSLISDFYAKKLQQDPCEDFGEEMWENLVDKKNDFSEKLSESIRTFSTFKNAFPYSGPIIGQMRCPYCRSRILKFVKLNELPMHSTAKCDNCEHIFELDIPIYKAVEDVYGAEDFARAMDGVDPVIVPCPDCGGSLYSIEAGACLACGYQQKYTECPVCQNSISIEEQGFGGICASCAHRTQDD